jgi:hypothetical protein
MSFLSYKTLLGTSYKCQDFHTGRRMMDISQFFEAIGKFNKQVGWPVFLSFTFGIGSFGSGLGYIASQFLENNENYRLQAELVQAKAESRELAKLLEQKTFAYSRIETTLINNNINAKKWIDRAKSLQETITRYETQDPFSLELKRVNALAWDHAITLFSGRYAFVAQKPSEETAPVSSRNSYEQCGFYLTQTVYDPAYPSSHLYGKYTKMLSVGQSTDIYLRGKKVRVLFVGYNDRSECRFELFSDDA